MFYACKKTDEGYSIVAKVSKPQAQRGCFILEGEEFPHPIIVEQNGKLEVQNNASKETEISEIEASKKSSQEAIRKEIKDALTIDELKLALNKLADQVLGKEKEEKEK